MRRIRNARQQLYYRFTSLRMLLFDTLQSTLQRASRNPIGSDGRRGVLYGLSTTASKALNAHLYQSSFKYFFKIYLIYTVFYAVFFQRLEYTGQESFSYLLITYRSIVTHFTRILNNFFHAESDIVVNLFFSPIFV